MIVEDEALLALELESELMSAGHGIVGTAMSSAQARALVDGAKPDFAFVDIHLADGVTGLDVGRYLAEHEIPFVFMTGNIKRIPDDFSGAIGAIEKPYTLNGLQNAIDFLDRHVCGDAGIETAPPSLVVPGRSGSAWPDGADVREGAGMA